MKPRSALYLRASGPSAPRNLARQQHHLERASRRRGFETSGIYCDVGSTNAVSRPGLEHLLAAVNAGLVDRMLIASHDRLSRRMPDSARIDAALRRAGTELLVAGDDLP